MKTKLFVSLLGISFLLFGCQKNIPQKTFSSTEKETQTIQYDGKILALGDSLTEGYGIDRSDSYPSQLKKFLQQKGYHYQVINGGISGETTTGLKERLDWTLTQNPDLIILTSGANDAMRGVDLELTKNNLETIIETIQAQKIPLIFSGMEIYENLGKKYVTDFKNLYPVLAKKYEVPFIPFFLAGVAGDPKLNNTDQIHPNKEGYQIIIEKNIWEILEPLLKKTN